MSDKKEWQFIDPIYYEGEAGYLATDSKNTKAFVDKLAKAYQAEKQRADRLEKELARSIEAGIRCSEENQKLKEALEFYKQLPMAEQDQYWTQELAQKCIDVAKEALK